MTLGLLDVVCPTHVCVERIDAEADHLDAAPIELVLDPGDLAELGGAHRREVLRMGEQHAPGVAEPFVEPDRAGGGLGAEVGRLVAQLQCGCRW